VTTDVNRLIGAVTRQLFTRDKDGSRARVLVATRTYDATRDDVWDGHNPARIGLWFLEVGESRGLAATSAGSLARGQGHNADESCARAKMAR
jgi:hypothetical protein